MEQATTVIGREALSLTCPEMACLPSGKAGLIWLFLPKGGNKHVLPSSKLGYPITAVLALNPHVHLATFQ